MAEKHRKGKRPRNDDRGLVCLADRVGNNGADDAAADGDQDGVIPGTNPLVAAWGRPQMISAGRVRSEEHTSELQSLMRISYAVFCLTKKLFTTTSHILLILPSTHTPI